MPDIEVLVEVEQDLSIETGTTGSQGPSGPPGPQGVQGEQGLVAATAPIAYDAPTATVSFLPAAAVTDNADNTGGTVDRDLAALANVSAAAVIGASVTDVNARMATINNNFADVHAEIAQLKQVLRDAGIIQP